MRSPKKVFPRIHYGMDILQKTRSNLVYFGLWSLISDLPPPIGGHHPVLYFPSQIQRNIVQRCASENRPWQCQDFKSLWNSNPSLIPRGSFWQGNRCPGSREVTGVHCVSVILVFLSLGLKMGSCRHLLLKVV